MFLKYVADTIENDISKKINKFNTIMKKITLIIVSLLLLAISGYAKQRTESEAQEIASSFFRQSLSSGLRAASGKPLQLAYTCRESGKTASYYVYNVDKDNGFVIVSGDDRAKSVLGYSDNGRFDINLIPENFKWWLSFYQSELEELAKQPELASSDEIAVSFDNPSKAFAKSIAPLLGGIKWNQRAPYNNLCPVFPAGNENAGQRTVTGCVATAMAQVMKYYQWPVKGTGSSSAYTTKTLKISVPAVDFSKTTYTWANMTETYSSSSTSTQNTAVATLMYHCGVAVQMDYGVTSSASPVDMVNAMINNFGYDANAQLHKRDYYTKAEWIDMIKTELNAKRPVLYEGHSTDVGHQFVCDGYDTNDLYHFNWGWGGMSDGYFELSALNPGATGTGGGNGGGYNTNQGIAVGVQKPNTASKPSYVFYMKDTIAPPANIARAGKFTLSVKEMYNYGANTFAGDVGLALCNNNGSVVSVLAIGSYTGTNSIKSYYGWKTFSVQDMSIASTVAAGNYRIYCVYRPTGASVWQIVRGKVGTPNYVNVQVTAGNVNFSVPTDVKPKLTRSNSNSLSIIGKLYQDKTGRFFVKVTNTGGEYNSYLGIYLQLKSNKDKNEWVVEHYPVNIATGETKEFELSGKVTMAAGVYSLWVMYDIANDRGQSGFSMSSIGNAIEVTVAATPTDPPNLTLTSKISFVDNNKVYKNSGELTAVIKNTGGLFDGLLVAFVFPKTLGNSLAYFGPTSPVIDNNETKTIKFRGSLDLPVPVEYTIIVFSSNSTTDVKWVELSPQSNSRLNFTLMADLTGFPNMIKEESVSLFPNPVLDKLYLISEDVVKHVTVFDLFGKGIIALYPNVNGEIVIPVETLRSGTYILRLETKKGITVQKFIKK